ncbi:MAG: YraN family protein [Omnitrophica bacterium]|nr:YraN family protein [Candidatus Omnitrophota bacterium]
MRDGNRALGKHGEDIAARFLSRKGYRIIGRNVRMFLGEIDIVAVKKRETIFVEVKTRRPSSFGPPHLAITWEKKRTLIRCALCYLKMKGIEDRACRIDVISIELDDSGRHIKNIEHFENAV